MRARVLHGVDRSISETEDCERTLVELDLGALLDRQLREIARIVEAGLIGLRSRYVDRTTSGE